MDNKPYPTAMDSVDVSVSSQQVALVAHDLCSLSVYFLLRITWLQNGSQRLFGKADHECVYVLIDTSHSMKSKLDLVKDKIIQFIQVR